MPSTACVTVALPAAFCIAVSLISSSCDTLISVSANLFRFWSSSVRSLIFALITSRCPSNFFIRASSLTFFTLLMPFFDSRAFTFSIFASMLSSFFSARIIPSSLSACIPITYAERSVLLSNREEIKPLSSSFFCCFLFSLFIFF